MANRKLSHVDDAQSEMSSNATLKSKVQFPVRRGASASSITSTPSKLLDPLERCRRKVRNDKKDKQGSSDCSNLIKNSIEKVKDEGFVYLTYKEKMSSVHFSPYNLKEEEYERVNKKEFYTLSSLGVTLWSSSGNTYTEIKEWEKEFNLFCKIQKIRTFAQFRLWKGFTVWRNIIKWIKYCNAKNFVQQNLFLVIPDLAQYLLRLRQDLYHLESYSFFNMSDIEDWQVFYFIERQMRTIEQLQKALKDFRAKAKEYLYDACYKALINKGFYAVDEATVFASAKKMREAMSFMDKAKKRKFCKLLSDYLTYCDYITVTFLQNLCAKSYADLANAFAAHHQCAPSEEKLRNTHYNDPIETPRTPSQPKFPFFNITLILRTTEIEVDPPMQVVINIFEQVLGIINETVHEMKRFTTDPFYLQFTEPSIMGRQEDRLARNPPDLAFTFNTDLQYQKNKKMIFETIRQSYKSIIIYLTKFESIRINYAIDVKTDADVVQSERDLEKLREYCRRCRDNISAIEDIPPNAPLGLINLKQTTFKEEIEPICKNLLGELIIYIPELAINEVQRTNEKAQDLVARITAEPTTTLEYINYLRFLNSSGVEVAALLEQVDYAHDVFIILKDFSIPIEYEEKENYIDCEDMANQCKIILQNKLDEKDRFIALLDEAMQLDIQAIFEEVNEVFVETQDPKYLDINSKRSEIRSMLNTLTSRLQQCQEKANEYIGYQQEFEIAVTEYGEIDQAFQEINYRKIVWSSVEEWERALLLWYKTPFHTLDTQELNDLTTKIYDTCVDLEEHLPPNDPMTELKASAEKFMKKLPVIGYLRNPELKPRHWLKIEKLIQRKVYQDEELKIGDFDDIHVFEDDFPHQLSKISGDATGEAQQELKLKSVEQVWKDTELVIESYKQAKDIFILGGIEKLEALVDESNITINNIMASPFMGPIKHKVEEWLRLLDTFSETLEEWSACQASWTTLEAIFSSPDVQKQLPQEVTMFGIVDRNFNEAMRRAFKISLALPIMTDPLNLDVMKINNQLLESIRKALEAYLEVKRLVFPRFFFVSNKEMLDILGQSKNPEAIQPHIKKFFDGIYRLELGYKETEKGEKIMTNDIVAMLSPEGERVLFGKGLKARGPSEDWLSKVETAMFLALRRYMKFGYQCYGAKQKSLWCQEHSIQVVLTVSQQQWAADVHDIFQNRQSEATAALEQYLDKWKSNLNISISMAKTQITNLFRKLINQLITVDLHAKFVMEALIKKRVTQESDFNWIRNFRVYWSTDTETMSAKMSYISINYFYEYLGSGVDLVITPLTDRCFLSLLCAFHMNLGGCIGGPTGAGKTETVKNLSKAVAKRCFLFNCAKFVGFKTIGQFLSGMSQSGAWCFFDEFDRLNTDVLSVVAQQLRTIYHAKSAGKKRLMFEGRETKLEISCAIFTTTFYYQVKRRTAIPDNLRTLFRTYYAIAVDAHILTETTLLFEGFEEYKALGNKLIRFYKLCEKQLSKQSQYDFSIRALKHTLTMAGKLLRMKKIESENLIVAWALRTTNMSRLLKEDAITFKSLLGDIFGIENYSPNEHVILKEALTEYLLGENLLPTPLTIINAINLYEAVTTRAGVIIFGSTGTGKTTAINGLAGALRLLHSKHVEGVNFRKVKLSVYYTNSIDMERYFGRFEKAGSSWKDGLVPLELRKECDDLTHQWIVFDGAIDHEWTECFNSFLDESKILCLNNAERFMLTNWHHIIFQTITLSSVSPSTMSRCALVYLRENDLNSLDVMKSWLENLDKSITPDIVAILNELYEAYLEKILDIDSIYGVRDIGLITIAKIQAAYDLLGILVIEALEHAHFSPEPDLKEQQIGKIFLWSTMWGICSSCEETSRGLIEQEVRKIMEADKRIEFPEHAIWDYKLNIELDLWEHWNQFIEPFKFDPTLDYCDLKVCTLNMIKHSYIFEILAKNKKNVLVTGNLGVGKSTLASMTLKNLVKYKIVPVLVNFACTTTSGKALAMFEAQGESRRKNQLSAPVGKIVVVVIEDFNTPFKNRSGSRPAVQFIRQILEFNGYYDRERLFWKSVIDMVVCGTCNVGGRYRDLPNARFFRHFAVLHLSEPTDDCLRSIFGKLLEGFFIDSPAVVQPILDKVINTNIDIFRRVATSLLPVPDKQHYIFNLHDLSKCVQGFLQCRSLNFPHESDICRLIRHEADRVYRDRLVHNQDTLVYNDILKNVIKDNFNEDIDSDELILFGEFMNNERMYEQILDSDKLRIHLVDAIEEHRRKTGVFTNIVLFDEAMRTIIAVCRWLRMHHGNGILIGLPGMGRDWITRLSAHLNDYLLFEIKLHRVLDRPLFLKKLQKLAKVAVLSNRRIVFLLQGMLITEDAFFEDMINLVDDVDFSELLTPELLAEAKGYLFKDTDGEMDLRTEKDAFLKRLRDNLHVVITLNNREKLQKTFRNFQGLVRAYSIRWLYNWTKDGLRNSAIAMFSDEEEDYRFKLADMASYIHMTVEKASEEYFLQDKQCNFPNPRLYVQFLDGYRKFVVDLRQKLLKRIDRITRGLKKLSDASKTVVTMQAELQVLEPQLERQAYVMQELITKLEGDMVAVEKVKELVAADEAVAKEKQIVTQAAIDDLNKDLEIAMPAIREAEELINTIGKNELNEVKNLPTPPTPVAAVFEAVCLLLGAKPAWATVKTLLNDPEFTLRLLSFDREHISDATLKKLKKYLENKEFTPAKLEKLSKVAKILCMWVIALDKFTKVYKMLDTKVMRKEAADYDYREALRVLRGKQQDLAEVEAKIQLLKDEIEEKNLEFKRLRDDVDIANFRIVRGSKLAAALADEETRWNNLAVTTQSQIESVRGDSMITSACISYLGAFTGSFRRSLLDSWFNESSAIGVAIDKHFDLIEILEERQNVINWTANGLAKDSFSVDNGIYVSRAHDWPLIIDPQEKASTWLKILEKENNLQVIKMNEKRILKTIETCANYGYPLIIEKIGDTLDPVVYAFFKNFLYFIDGQLVARIKGMTIKIHNNFRLYLITNLLSPRYRLEDYNNVSLINFTLTHRGLEEILWGYIVEKETPDLEKQRVAFELKMLNDKLQLIDMEKRILDILLLAPENMLDDESVVETLCDGKETLLILSTRYEESAEGIANVVAAQEKFLPLATYAVCVYFSTVSLADINPMYQFTIHYLRELFMSVILKKRIQMTPEEKFEILTNELRQTLHFNMTRGLYDKHIVVFNYLLATSIEKEAGRITDKELEIFRTTLEFGEDSEFKSSVKKPDDVQIGDHVWYSCKFLEHTFPDVFANISKEAEYQITISIYDLKVDIDITNKKAACPTDWETKLTDFQKLLLIRTLKLERLITAVNAFARKMIGDFCTSVHEKKLSFLYKEIDNSKPLVFLLANGYDPTNELIKFVEQKKFSEKFTFVSLGVEQETLGEATLEKGIKLGTWVYLQNCHLATTTWLAKLADILNNIILKNVKTHPDFRLFLSSLPTPNFPRSILECSVKISLESPKGVRSSLLRILNDLDTNFFESHVLGKKWRMIVFGLCMCHAVLMQRQKYGSVGWSNIYEFNDNDLNVGLRVLDKFIDRGKIGPINWAGFSKMNRKITYGGLTTNFWDYRCLTTTFQKYCSPLIFEKNYSYDKNGIYRNPNFPTKPQVMDYVKSWPKEDDPTIFGMHENADICLRRLEADHLIEELWQESRPKDLVIPTKYDQCLEILDEITESLNIVVPEAVPDDTKLPLNTPSMRPLKTALTLEMGRLNFRYKLVRRHVTELSDAIHGRRLMSDELEGVCFSLVNKQLPRYWSSRITFANNLASWIKNFQMRMYFFKEWIEKGNPISWWLGGFFYPQCFLAGYLQTYAIQEQVSIENLSFDYEVQTQIVYQQDIARKYRNGEETDDAYGGLTRTEAGVYIHGLFIEYGSWDISTGMLCDAIPNELCSRFPAIMIKACVDLKQKKRCEIPLYQTVARSKDSVNEEMQNLILAILLKARYECQFWNLRGTALFSTHHMDIA